MFVVKCVSSGKSYSDFQMYKLVRSFKALEFNHYEMTSEVLMTSTHNVIDAVKVAIKAGYINPSYVVFEIECDSGWQLVKVDENAKPVDGQFPSYFLDDALDYLRGNDNSNF